MSSTVPAIELRQLAFRYAEGHEALRAVNLSIAPGECVGLIGPNGAGKSTLLLHLNGILPDPSPTHPSVFIDGLPVVADHLAEVRRRVGLLFQDPDDQLFCSTVEEDVAFGPRQLGITGAALAECVAQALRQVGLHGFEQRSPHRLSTGEKRRVCLAGVLACGPGVLALDEPTSGLDPRGRRELKALLQRTPVTKIIATHDLELVVELCDRVVLMDAGLVIAQGPTRELLADEPLMLDHGLERPHILLHNHPHAAPAWIKALLPARSSPHHRPDTPPSTDAPTRSAP